MHLFFGQVPKQYEEDSEYFERGDKKFYFRLDLELEDDGYGQVTITDTCDRYMPVDLDQLDALITVLQLSKGYIHDTKALKNNWKQIFSD